MGDDYLRRKKRHRLRYRTIDLEPTDSTIRTKHTGEYATLTFAAYLGKDNMTNMNKTSVLQNIGRRKRLAVQKV